MSRSCPRVISPEPTRSTLITSAPIHARSWVQVGPDCTCVKSRMRTPSSALPAWPQGFVDGFVDGFVVEGLVEGFADGFDDNCRKELPFADLAGGFFAASFTAFFADFLR